MTQSQADARYVRRGATITLTDAKDRPGVKGTA